MFKKKFKKNELTELSIMYRYTYYDTYLFHNIVHIMLWRRWKNSQPPRASV